MSDYSDDGSCGDAFPEGTRVRCKVPVRIVYAAGGDAFGRVNYEADGPGRLVADVGSYGTVQH